MRRRYWMPGIAATGMAVILAGAYGVSGRTTAEATSTAAATVLAANQTCATGWVASWTASPSSGSFALDPTLSDWLTWYVPTPPGVPVSWLTMVMPAGMPEPVSTWPAVSGASSELVVEVWQPFGQEVTVSVVEATQVVLPLLVVHVPM